jgi:uncharacterized membrane protein YeiH
VTPYILDLAAVAVFAATGALVASRSQLDIVGFVFVACLTALGGGTLRDLLLDRPVLWMQAPVYLGVASAVAVAWFFAAPLVNSRYRWLVWLDACALAVAVPAGVAAAAGAAWPVVLVMGVLTGCVGGLMRDVVCNEVPLVLKAGEPYATAALAGAAAALVAASAGYPGSPALVACGLVTFGLRAGALAFGWRLPVYRSRPPRPEHPKR